MGTATSRAGRKRAVTAAVEEVAEYLGNTPAVCRNGFADRERIERAVLKLIAS